MSNYLGHALEWLRNVLPHDVPRTETLSDAERYLSPLEREGVQDSADAATARALLAERKTVGVPWWELP